ncbi:uncharacterized protein METZ01_LOCUS331568, partial [marine metagenome]
RLPCDGRDGPRARRHRSRQPSSKVLGKPTAGEKV